jgi:hypothetical protein
MSTTGLRLVYANAKNTLMRHNINPAKAVLSQSYLRFEAPLTTTTTQYNLDVLVNDNLNPNNVTQNKLNLQDAFIASQIGIFIGIPATNSVAEGRVKLYSYPDRTEFTAAIATNALFWIFKPYSKPACNSTVMGSLPSLQCASNANRLYSYRFNSWRYRQQHRLYNKWLC